MTPLISIIIPTKNSSEFLEECLKSCRDAIHRVSIHRVSVEIIVVDNFSNDDTMEIAKKYADQVFQQGPERSAQRNFGVKQAKGKYVLIIDSDMKLSENVIASCVKKTEGNSRSKEDFPLEKGNSRSERYSPLERGNSRSGWGVLKPSANSPYDSNTANPPVALIIPEESFGIGFWAKCKKLEKSFYVGIDWMEAARFFEKEIFEKAGGYDENMVSGEDWDLSQRTERFGKIGRISDLIYHNEGKVSLLKTIKKKFYYAGKFAKYVEKNKKQKKLSKQTGIISRYKLFLSQPKKLFKKPIIGIGMLLMKTCEFGFGGIGYLIGKTK